MKKVKVHNRQSIWDLAAQYYGDASAVMQLMIDNPDTCNLNDAITPGTEIWIDETKVTNQPVVDYFQKRNYTPATAIDYKAGAIKLQSGGYLRLQSGGKLLLQQ